MPKRVAWTILYSETPHTYVEVNAVTRWRSFSSRGDSRVMLFNDSVQERDPNICSLEGIGPQKILPGGRAPHDMGSARCELAKVDGGPGGNG